MSEIISLFTVFSLHLSATTLRQFCRIVFAVLAMTGGVTMRNISRWDDTRWELSHGFKGSSIPCCLGKHFTRYSLRHICLIPMMFICLRVMKLLSPKIGDKTYGLSRFFSSTIGKAIPGLAFFAVSIISVKQRRSYPMCIEQVVRGEVSATPPKKATASKPAETKGKPGRPKREQEPKQDRGRPQ